MPGAGAMTRELQGLENLLPVHVLVLCSLGMHFILFLCAGARRRKTSRSLQVRMILLWVAYKSGDIFSTYTLAHFSFIGATGNHPLVALWAPFLLLHLAGPDNIAAYALQDKQLSRRSLQTFISHVTAGGYFLYTHRKIGGDFIRLASRLMFVVGVVKYGERWLAVQRGSLGSIRDSVKKQPVPGMNCSHVHAQDVKLEKIKGLETLDEESSVRRAHSFFHICKCGMVDYPEDRPGKQNFMEKMEHVEWWTIVEMQLSLMYDILYTKAAVIHTWHGYTIRVISPLAILTSLLLFHFGEEDTHRKVDTATTYVLFGSALFMECTSLLNALGSSWMFTTLSNIRSPWLRDRLLCSGRWDRLRRQVVYVNSLLSFGGSSRSGARRWSGHMGQYNMLHFCTRPNTLLTRPLLGRLAKLVGLGELWNRKHFSGAIKISDHDLIKDCITKHADLLYKKRWINTLGTTKHHWGLTALAHRNMEYEFKYVLGNEFQEGIIIWHIATDFFLSMCNGTKADDQYMKAIMVVSNYMMFLLVERPYMLPGNAHNKLYERTCEALKGLNHQPIGICAVLKSLFRWHDDPAGCTYRALDSKTCALKLYDKHVALQVFSYETVRLNYSAEVAKELLDYEKKLDTTKALKLLLEVWADMLVYAANRCSRESHAKKLSSGGELTTIAWLMVEHYHQALLHQSNSAQTSDEVATGKEDPVEIIADDAQEDPEEDINKVEDQEAPGKEDPVEIIVDDAQEDPEEVIIKVEDQEAPGKEDPIEIIVDDAPEDPEEVIYKVEDQEAPGKEVPVDITVDDAQGDPEEVINKVENQESVRSKPVLRPVSVLRALRAIYVWYTGRELE